MAGEEGFAARRTTATAAAQTAIDSLMAEHELGASTQLGSWMRRYEGSPQGVPSDLGMENFKQETFDEAQAAPAKCHDRADTITGSRTVRSTLPSRTAGNNRSWRPMPKSSMAPALPGPSMWDARLSGRR